MNRSLCYAFFFSFAVLLSVPSSMQAQTQVAQHINALQDDAPEVRARAACALGKMGGRRASSAIPALIALLSDDTPVHRSVCETRDYQWNRYTSPKTPACVRKYSDLCEETSPGSRAAHALSQMGDLTSSAMLDN